MRFSKGEKAPSSRLCDGMTSNRGAITSNDEQASGSDNINLKKIQVPLNLVGSLLTAWAQYSLPLGPFSIRLLVCKNSDITLKNPKEKLD